MGINYQEGTLLWYWFEQWIVVGGFVVALTVAARVVGRSGWGIGGLLLKALMVGAILATLPLTLIRMGMNITIQDDLMVGNASLAGVAGSLVVGLPYLIASRRIEDKEWVQRIAPLYRTAVMVCDHFRRVMVPNALGEEQWTAMSLVLAELPPALETIGATRQPRSARARRARRSLQKALHRYISTAKLAEQLFQELQKGQAVEVSWNQTDRAARSGIIAHISSRIEPTRRDMERVKAYFA